MLAFDFWFLGLGFGTGSPPVRHARESGNLGRTDRRKAIKIATDWVGIDGDNKGVCHAKALYL